MGQASKFASDVMPIPTSHKQSILDNTINCYCVEA